MTAPLFASAAFKADPFPIYAEWRRHRPVARVRLPHGEPAWVVTRTEAVVSLLKDARLVKDPRSVPQRRDKAVPGFLQPLRSNMLERDGPDHRRLRGFIQRVFLPARVEQLRDFTRDAAERLLDGLEAHSQFDLLNDFAMPLPVQVISELLGVPSADRLRFARWSRRLIELQPRPWSLLTSLPSVIAFLAYLRRLLKLRSSAPTGDLISDLVQLDMDADELLAMVTLLLTAGFETTANLIANGSLALLQHDHGPDSGGWQLAVEELLRFTSPVETTTLRIAREPLEIDGQVIAAGDVVLAALASANRDPARFSEPDRLDLRRHPNPHLTFGLGSHFCAGAALARLEGEAALQALWRRFPGLRLRRAPRWKAGLVVRGVRELWVSPGNR